MLQINSYVIMEDVYISNINRCPSPQKNILGIDLVQ
jgi:hypothetical protein